MEIIYAILLEIGKGLAFVLVSFACLVSALILFRPTWVQALNASFSQSFSTRPLAKTLDIQITTTEKVIKHRFIVGALLVFASAYVLWSLMGSFDSGGFIIYLAHSISLRNHLLLETGLEILRGLIVFGAGMGLISGITLLTRPEWFINFTQKMDQSYLTREAFGTLDQSYDLVDAWVWKHHVSVGLVLFAGSTGLLVVCIKMLLNGGLH